MTDNVSFDDARICDHLGQIVRGTAEENLIGMCLAVVLVRRVEDII